MEGLLAVVGIFGMPVFIVFIYFHFANKSKEQFHTTLQKLRNYNRKRKGNFLFSKK